MKPKKLLSVDKAALFYVDVTPPEYKAPFIFTYIIDPGQNKPLILIETGPVSQADRLIKALGELDVESRGLEIYVTHIHLDHAGAAGLIANKFNARVHVHPRGAKHLVDPSKLWAASREVLGEIAEIYGEPEPLRENLASPTTDKEHKEIERVKLVIYHTPGHASHHQSILAKIGEVSILFPGDSAGITLSGADAVVPTTPPPLRLDLYKESLKLQMSLKPSHVAYTHASLAEPAILERHWRQVLLWEEIIGKLYEKGVILDEVLKTLYEVDSETRRFIDVFSELSPYLIETVKHSIEGFIKYFEWVEKNK